MAEQDSAGADSFSNDPRDLILDYPDQMPLESDLRRLYIASQGLSAQLHKLEIVELGMGAVNGEQMFRWKLPPRVILYETDNGPELNSHIASLSVGKDRWQRAVYSLKEVVKIQSLDRSYSIWTEHRSMQYNPESHGYKYAHVGVVAQRTNTDLFNRTRRVHSSLFEANEDMRAPTLGRVYEGLNLIRMMGRWAQLPELEEH